MPTILVVEDDSDIRAAYAFALAKAGYRVVEATDGAEALAQLEQEPPAVIILDMLMPGISGIEFLRQSNVAKTYPTTTVLAFSNIDSPRVVQEAKALGATEYLVKVNVTPHQMVELVGRYAAVKQ